MKLKYKLLIVVISIACKVDAQNIGLYVGESLPDIYLNKLINSTQAKTRTSDFFNQLLIIDFWATTCSGCVHALPHLDTLQKVFGSKIKILPVTYEKEDLVNSFWRKSKFTKHLSLPSVVEDEQLTKYFRHQIIPHEVWIFKGVVVGITNEEYVNANNINKILSGEKVNWPVKNDFYSHDQNKPLFDVPEKSNKVGSTDRYTAISGYKEKISLYGTFSGGSGMIRDKQKKTVRTYFINQPIYNSYFFNWVKITNVKLVKPGGSDFLPRPNEVIWEVKDKSKYVYDKKYGYSEEWIRRNSICFESVRPDIGQNDAEVTRQLIADLDSLLNLHVRWEKRKEKVLVLVRTTQTDNMKSKKALTGYYEDKMKKVGSLYHFRDVGIPIPFNMNQQASNPYVFDETGYAGKVDMDLNIASWTDIPAIRKAIAAYGLDLKEEERTVDKFVFSEKDYKK